LEFFNRAFGSGVFQTSTLKPWTAKNDLYVFSRLYSFSGVC